MLNGLFNNPLNADKSRQIASKPVQEAVCKSTQFRFAVVACNAREEQADANADTEGNVRVWRD